MNWEEINDMYSAEASSCTPLHDDGVTLQQLKPRWFSLEVDFKFWYVWPMFSINRHIHCVEVGWLCVELAIGRQWKVVSTDKSNA